MLNWDDGKLTSKHVLPLDRTKVERACREYTKKGYRLVTLTGRDMHPAHVYTTINNRSQTLIITKEKGISRQMNVEIKRWIKMQSGRKRKVMGEP